MEQVLEMDKRNLPKDHPDIATGMANLAHTYANPKRGPSPPVSLAPYSHNSEGMCAVQSSSKWLICYVRFSPLQNG